MDLVLFPFHDLRKSQKHGFRNRDGHFMQHLISDYNKGKVLIVNRPMNPVEAIVNGYSFYSKGELVKSFGRSRVIKISENVWAFDYINYDAISLLIQRKKWFWDQYDSSKFHKRLNQAMSFLEIDAKQSGGVIWNLYGGSLLRKLKLKRVLFDGFDNWMKIPLFSKYKRLIEDNYRKYSEICEYWTTNSEANRTYYNRNFNPQNCQVLRSGVDVERFAALEQSNLPDLENIQRPIIGYGGKFSHLMDIELINHVTAEHPDKSFVFVGQVFDKALYEKLEKRDNVYFLGDKSYDDYPKYLNSFDIGIIPYVVDERSHGGDSLKFYEYLASNLPTVSTDGNGVSKISDNIYLFNDKIQFSKSIDLALKNGWVQYTLPVEYTWKHKTDKILSLLYAV